MSVGMQCQSEFHVHMCVEFTLLLVYNLDDSTHVSLLYDSIGVILLMIVILAVVSSNFL